MPISSNHMRANMQFDYSLDSDSVYTVIDAEISDKGLISHQLDSVNDFYKNGISQIVTQIFSIEKSIKNTRSISAYDRNIDKIDIVVKFTDTTLHKPTMNHYHSGKEEILFPQTALLEDRTYSANLFVNATITATAYMKNGNSEVRTDTIKNARLCRIPIMVGSQYCNTYGLPAETLTRMNHDPTDPGGYFIVKGVEWSIDSVESILFNQIQIFRSTTGKEMYRCQFISKPGDTYQNSGQIIVRWLNDNQLTIEISRDKLVNIHIPFYIIFRIFGWTTDKDVFDNIVWDYNNDTGKKLFNYLKDSYKATYDICTKHRYTYEQVDAIKAVIDELKTTSLAYLQLDKYPDNYHQAIKEMLKFMDIHLLPHIGIGAKYRVRKLRFLSIILRKIFLVHMGNLELTDRDSYKSKRIHTVGISYAKSFKIYFNASIVQQIKKKITKDFKAMSFNVVDLAATVVSSIYSGDFERSMVQAITAGNKSQLTINKMRKITNRLSSQLVNRKNQISMLNVLRQVTTTGMIASKQAERTHEMRRIHMSFLGYICVVHSPDGEKVGVNKQLAISAIVSGFISSEVIKDMLRSDSKRIIPIDEVYFSELSQLSNIYVNGDWIGCTKNSIELVNTYRQMRRDMKINPHLTICWDNTQDDIYFWADVGRLLRPLLIVYNNLADNHRNNYKFEQGTKLTIAHIKGLQEGSVTIEDLYKEQIIEYIAPEEQENYYICPSFDALKNNRYNELHEYTHCDWPQSQLGITALTSPCGHHNQITKLTFQTSQVKQTCGYPMLNWPFRADKETFIQYQNEVPLVKTVVNNYTFPGGCNVIVAIMCYTGQNEEDSLIINKGAIDRGLFNGSRFTYYKSELESKEEFGVPDKNKTSDIKNANYDKLNDYGMLSVGTVLEKGDALIGKVMTLQKQPQYMDNDNDQRPFIDKSIIYKEDESAIVHNVIEAYNDDDEHFCKVILRHPREPVIGDKYCLSPDHEVLTFDKGWIPIDQVTTESYIMTLDRNDNNLISYQKILNCVEFDHNGGSMFKVEAPQVDLYTTLNHRMYVDNNVVEASSLFNKTCAYSNNGRNNNDDYLYFNIQTGQPQMTRTPYEMDAWLQLFGIVIDQGCVYSNKPIKLLNSSIYNIVFRCCQKLNIDCKIIDNNTLYIMDNSVVDYFSNISYIHNAVNYQLPQYIYLLSKRQSTILLDAITLSSKHTGSTQVCNKYYHYMFCNIKHCKQYNAVVYYGNKAILDALQVIAIMAGYNIVIDSNLHNSLYKATIYQIVNPIAASPANPVYGYSGKVYCVEVSTGIFMVRRNGKCVWTHNSSRAGQKGIAGTLMRETDMPFTSDGVRPSVLFNPMGIPTRMTVGQLFEMLLGIKAANEGNITDATIFKSVNVEEIGDYLEKNGFHRYGNQKLYSGITGEPIDSLIFIGPTYYQRIQKFVRDAVYSVNRCSTDVLTHQPVEGGKASGSSLRSGEMEINCITSHGTIRALSEKFFDHSDGYLQYICRCGRPAIINKQHNIYRCKYCGDNAVIYAVPGSWSSKLFLQELDAMNIGITTKLEPHKFYSM